MFDNDRQIGVRSGGERKLLSKDSTSTERVYAIRVFALSDF